MPNTYRTAGEADRDKARLAGLLDALSASPSTLRRDEAGLWVLRGRPGCYASTWGDPPSPTRLRQPATAGQDGYGVASGKSWQLVVAPDEEMSKQAWTWIKKRLAFCELTQDSDAEGVFRLHRLPTAAEAEEIRDIVGIRKRIELSPEELARRQQLGRRLAAH